MATLSIYGLTQLTSDNIFDNLVLPTQVDSDTVIDRLVLDTFELEVLYPDPDFFSIALGIYSESRLETWQKLADDIYYTYDPFINFTRDEARVNTITRDLNDLREDHFTDGNLKTTKRNAWNGSTGSSMVNESEIGDSGNNDGTSNVHSSGTIKTEDYYHSQGDSAMYTPTDIARKEWELRAEHSIVEFIVEDLKTHFCLMVY